MAAEKELLELAIEVLKKKDTQTARTLLQQVVKINPKNEQAWTLLAEASDEPAERLKYLKRAEKIKKANDVLLEEINKLQPKPSKPKIVWNKTTRLRAVLLFLLFTLIPSLWWLYFDVIPTLRSEKRMTGEWNAAIVNFTNLDTDLRRSDITLISNVFSNRFSQEMTSVAENANLIVQVWGPQMISQTISGKTPEERAVEAEQLADKYNADMLIYGTIQKTAEGYILQPEFYLRADNYYEASELVGQHRFGGAISILANRDSLPAQLPLNIELARRSEILSLVARGLSLYLLHSYDQALDLFTQANQDELWQNSDGRETVYLFQGNAAIKMRQFDRAYQAYEQAITLKPDYGRGYIGLGNVYYSKSSESVSQSPFSPDSDSLIQAKNNFQYALQIADSQPPSAEIPSKAAFGLGQIYLVEWFLGSSTREMAVQNFQQVIGDYAEGGKPQLQELASESYARLAVIDRQDGDLKAALDKFQRALELSTLPDRKGLYWASSSDLYAQIGDAEQSVNASRKAIEQYQLALALPMPDAMKAHYWARIAEQYEILEDTGQAIAAYEQALTRVSVDSPEYSAYQQRLKELNP